MGQYSKHIVARMLYQGEINSPSYATEQGQNVPYNKMNLTTKKCR